MLGLHDTIPSARSPPDFIAQTVAIRAGRVPGGHNVDVQV